MLLSLVDFILKMVFPKAPPWVGTLLSTAIPAIIDLVDAIDDVADKSGQQKFEFVVNEVREMLDDSLDSLPEWGDIDEEARDRILGGLVEFAVFVNKVADDEGKKSARRRVRRAIKKIGR